MKKLTLPLILLLAACATQPVPEPAPEPIAIPVPVPPPSPPAVVAAPEKPKPKPVPLVVAKPKPEPKVEKPEPLPAVTVVNPSEDLWHRIRKGFAIADLKGPLVTQKQKQYAARPEYLQRIIGRSKLYLYHIVEEIERRGLPMELALLPMVESAFNPMAYSRAHASGLWQFIPGTGRRFDLKQDWWYDGRRDIVDSTDAALDYLTKLHNMWGDWHLALASYNWGEGAVARAIAKNRKAGKRTNYSSLKMPRETRDYVPKLQALKNIIADPAAYGIDLDPIPNEPYFTVITDPPELDIALAAKLAEMPLDDFIALNPGFSRPFIRSTAGARIVLPSEKVGVFHHNLARHDPNELVSWQVYRPARGETLARIADRFRLSLAELKRVNGIPARSSQVPPTLVVPISEDAGAAASQLRIMYAPPVASAPLRHVHRVRPGDTLSSIAAKYKVRLADLKRWNPGAGVLHVGEKIYIRGR